MSNLTTTKEKRKKKLIVQNNFKTKTINGLFKKIKILYVIIKI
jgi:hypothetical protein